jgi:hypothetical protein
MELLRSGSGMKLSELADQDEVILILDDFHRLSAGAARDSVAWFIDHLPPTFQLASVDAASAGGPGDTSGGADWRALTSCNAARLLRRFPDARQAASATSSSGMAPPNSSTAVEQPGSPARAS